MTGFMQFGGGILAGLIVAALGSPLIGLATVLPLMPLVGIVLHLVFKNRATRLAAAE